MTIGSAILNDKQSAGDEYEVSSVRKALELLCAFRLEDSKRSLTALADTVGIPKSTAHNLLKTLQLYDFVRQDAETKRYQLGPRVHELGFLFSQGSDLIPRAAPFLRKLAEQTMETVKLGVLSNGQMLVVFAIESPHQLHTRGDVGRRWCLHSSGLGKAILAALPLEEALELIQRQGMQRFTSRTITDIHKLEANIREARVQGYALDWEENEPGVRCLASGVRGAFGIVAAVSVSGPRLRITEKTSRELALLVVEAARNIAGALRS
jgi:IclR family transcriptional regulator, KDG regulon repressor